MLSKRILFFLAVLLLPSSVFAQISGTVHNGSAAGIANIEVNIYDLSYNLVNSAVTDSNGNYTIANVANGHYKVEFYAGSTGYATEWYNDQLNFYLAEEVEVSDPNANVDVDAVLELGGSISGTVTNVSGTGVSGLTVDIYDINYNPLAASVTDVDGNYTVHGLPGGGAKVMFTSPLGSNYVTEWYNDKTNFYTADVIQVTVSQDTSGIDAVLELGGSISGRVTNISGTGLSDISIDVYDINYNLLAASVTDVNGNYTVHGVPVGGVKVSFFSVFGSDYVDEWYDDKTDFYTADVIQVTASQDTPNINAVLEIGGRISGTVTDISGNGINCSVTVYDSVTHDYIKYANTISSGYYLVDGLRAGSYKIEFSPSATNYIREWYDDASSFELANSVTVTAPQETPGIDAVLELGGTVSGRVTDSDGAGIETVLILAFTENDVIVGGASPDSEGNYTMTGIPPGSIKIRFSDWNGVYEEQWYNNKQDYASADTLNIVIGSSTTGIDAVLHPPVPVITPVLMLLLGQ